MSADYDSVASRTSINETRADMDCETVVSSLLGSVSNGKRDRDLNVVQTLKDRQNLHKILERKAELAVRRKNWLSKDDTKLRQTWRSNIGKREIMLCSPCVPGIHRLVRVLGRCSCTLLSAPLLMRAWHSLHITIKAQTQKHTVHWTHLLRAFLYHGSGALIFVPLRNGTGSQRVTFWDGGTNGCANAT